MAPVGALRLSLSRVSAMRERLAPSVFWSRTTDWAKETD